MHRNHPGIPFERYADDAICHCSSEEQAAALRVALENRFAECGLTLHPEKTKIVYCKDDDRRGDYPNQKFDFLGYTFRPRLARRRAGKIGVSFSPAVSNKALKAIRRPCAAGPFRSAVTSRWTIWRGCSTRTSGLDQRRWSVLPVGALPDPEAHRCHPGAMGLSEVQGLVQAQDAGHPLAGAHCAPPDEVVRPLEPALWPRPNNGSRMTRECHVRFCESAGLLSPRATHRNIYVRSRRAGERVMASVSRFLAGKLRLKVNEAKSAVARPEERKFLGFSIANDGSERRIAPKALATFKARIRDMTPGPGDQSAAGDRRAHAIPDRVARLLRLLPDPPGAHEIGSVDPPKTPHVSLAAVAERAQPLQGTLPPWRAKVPGSGRRRFADGVLAHVRTPGGPTGPAQPLLRLPRSSQTPCPRPSLTRSNRRGT